MLTDYAHMFASLKQPLAQSASLCRQLHQVKTQHAQLQTSHSLSLTQSNKLLSAILYKAWPANVQGFNKLGGTSTKSVQSESASSQSSTPSTPLRVLRRSSSSQGYGGSFRHNGTGPRTLMYFKGCPRPLGCTVLLKGADARQLVLLKKAVKVWSAALPHALQEARSCLVMPLLLKFVWLQAYQTYRHLRLRLCMKDIPTNASFSVTWRFTSLLPSA